MALKATIFKLDLQVDNIDHHYYQAHQLTIARHPSENNERMLYRIIAFALNAHPALEFTRGISTADEPDLWRHTDSGEIDQWIELGHPDEKRLRKACGRAQQVLVYSYQQRSGEIWWQQLSARTKNSDNLIIAQIIINNSNIIDKLISRQMQLNCTIQDGTIWLTNSTETLEITTQPYQ
ncbi:MAG: YaeQ family protein [Gammaproteobacteria bacterium]|nr:YaeQ family protein [Gammaproteobacteria bacterium]